MIISKDNNSLNSTISNRDQDIVNRMESLQSHKQMTGFNSSEDLKFSNQCDKDELLLIVNKSCRELDSQLRDFILQEINDVRDVIDFEKQNAFKENKNVLDFIAVREKETKELSFQLVNFEREMKTVTDRINLHIDNLNLQFAELRKNWKEEIDAFYRKKKREQSDNLNEMNKIKELIKQSTTLSGVVKDALGSMGFIVCTLLEISSIQATFEIHELKDRKEISLYGSKPEANGNAARTNYSKDNKANTIAVKLDQKCIS